MTSWKDLASEPLRVLPASFARRMVVVLLVALVLLVVAVTFAGRPKELPDAAAALPDAAVEQRVQNLIAERRHDVALERQQRTDLVEIDVSDRLHALLERLVLQLEAEPALEAGPSESPSGAEWCGSSTRITPTTKAPPP